MAVSIFRNLRPQAFNKLYVWTSSDEKDVSASPTVTSGSGVPSASLPKGSIYLRTGGTGLGELFYQATDSSGTWAAIGSLSGNTGTSFTINADGSAATDEDPSLILKGGDGVAATNDDLVLSTLTQDSSLEILKYTITRSRNGGQPTRISPVLQIGQPLETVAGLDASIVFGASNDAGTSKTANIQYRGQEEDLSISGDGSFSTSMNFNATNGLDVSGDNLTIDNAREMSYRRFVKVIINAVGGSAGATAGTMDVDVQTLDSTNVGGIKRIKILASLTAPNPHALVSTVTFGTATAGTIVATGNGYVIADTDSTGNFTCVPSDSADETVYFWAESFPGVGSAGQGAVVVECIADTATWAA